MQWMRALLISGTPVDFWRQNQQDTKQQNSNEPLHSLPHHYQQLLWQPTHSYQVPLENQGHVQQQQPQHQRPVIDQLEGQPGTHQGQGSSQQLEGQPGTPQGQGSSQQQEGQYEKHQGQGSSQQPSHSALSSHHSQSVCGEHEGVVNNNVPNSHPLLHACAPPIQSGTKSVETVHDSTQCASEAEAFNYVVEEGRPRQLPQVQAHASRDAPTDAQVADEQGGAQRGAGSQGVAQGGAESMYGYLEQLPKELVACRRILQYSIVLEYYMQGSAPQARWDTLAVSQSISR